MPPGSDCSSPGLRSSAPTSILDDTLAPTNSSFPSLHGSDSPLLHPACRTTPPRPPAGRRWRSHYLISYSRTVRSVTASQPQLFRGSLPMIPPIRHCLASDNPLAALPRVYRSGPAKVLISAFDISLRLILQTCIGCVNPHASRTGTQYHGFFMLSKGKQNDFESFS